MTTSSDDFQDIDFSNLLGPSSRQEETAPYAPVQQAPPAPDAPSADPFGGQRMGLGLGDLARAQLDLDDDEDAPGDSAPDDLLDDAAPSPSSPPVTHVSGGSGDLDFSDLLPSVPSQRRTPQAPRGAADDIDFSNITQPQPGLLRQAGDAASDSQWWLEFPKGIPHGGAGLVGGAIAAPSEVSAHLEHTERARLARQREIMDAIDRGETPTVRPSGPAPAPAPVQLTPAQEQLLAQYEGQPERQAQLRAYMETQARGAPRQPAPLSTDEQILQQFISQYGGSSAERRAQLRAEIDADLAAPPPVPLAERGLYQAGRAVSAWDPFPAAPGYEQAVSRQLGEGLGSMLGGLALTGGVGLAPGMAGRVGGHVVGALAFSGAGIDEATRNAQEFDKRERAAGRPGLTEAQIAAAGVLGVLPGATDIVPIENALHNMRIAGLTQAGTRTIARAIAAVGGRIFGQVLIEGGQEGFQQFLQNVISWRQYNPDQHLSEGVLQNLLIGAGVGGITQGGQEAFHGIMRLGRRGGRAGSHGETGATAPGTTPPDSPAPSPETAPAPEAMPPPHQGQPPGTPPDAEPGIESLGPDAPSAEPIDDLLAQAQDLADPENPRQGLWLSAANLDALANDPQAASDLRLKLASIVEGELSPEVLRNLAKGDPDAIDAYYRAIARHVSHNFDGQGGDLIASTPAMRARAERTRDGRIENGDPAQQVHQEIIGRLTGAGTGKPPSATGVVQQVTPQGAVTRESAVTPATQAETEADLAAPGRTVRTVTPQEAIGRRTALVSNAAKGPGTRANPVRPETPDDVAVASLRVPEEPTEAQREAGNYPKGHLNVHGLDISIETAKGGIRRGDGWENVSPAAYGYFKGPNVKARARDGEHPDVYVGDNPQSTRAFIIDQYEPDSDTFDEPKVVVGVDSQAEATRIYDAGFSNGSGPQRRGRVSEVSIDELKAWLRDGDATRPYAPTDEQINNILDLTDEEIEDIVEEWQAIKVASTEKGLDRARLAAVAEMIERLGDTYGRHILRATSEDGVRDYLYETQGRGYVAAGPEAAAETDAGARGPAQTGEAGGRGGEPATPAGVPGSRRALVGWAW